MPNIASVLKSEITRLARKEVKAELAATKKATTTHRREIAELKRQIKDQAKKIVVLERATATAKPAEPEVEVEVGAVRFSPKWVRTHREKLQLSQRAYAALVGVTSMTIYNWESGRTRPAAKQLAAWGVVRAMGKREAWRRLEEME